MFTNIHLMNYNATNCEMIIQGSYNSVVYTLFKLPNSTSSQYSDPKEFKVQHRDL